MKLFHTIGIALAWEQPTYRDAMSMALAKRGGWGHPVDNVGKAAATWSLCPELTLPTGVAGKVCDGSTCMVVCEPGKVAMGRRRIKCRWKRSKGFFWKQELPTCSGCDPEDPTTAIADSNMTAECAVNNLNKNKCTLKCSNGGTIFGRNKVKMTCKCPRINGVKTCGWTMFKSQLSSAAITQLSCDGGTSAATSEPTTVAGDSTATSNTSMASSDGPTTLGDSTTAVTTTAPVDVTSAAGVSTEPIASTASGETTALGDSTSLAGSTTAMGDTTAPNASTESGESTAQAESTAPSDTTAATSAAETATSGAETATSAETATASATSAP